MGEFNSRQAAESPLPLAALRAFDLAARLGSFRAAAEAANLTPSAVSHQVRVLETTLGVRLFIREPRGVQLTVQGEELARHVRQGFTALARGMETVRGDDRARRIHVSALGLFSQSVLLPSLAKFHARWPQYEVRIQSTPRFVDFIAEDVDVGVRVGDGDWPGLKATELLRIRGLPVASSDYLEASGISQPEDLIGARLIHDTAQPTAWRGWLQGHGVHRSEETGDLWLDSAPAALHAAEQGLGVVLGIDPLVRLWPGFGNTLRPAFPELGGPHNRYWLVRRPEADRQPKVRAFAEWVREACEAVGRIA